MPLLLQASVHPKIVQERLGHSSISVTIDMYSHVVPGLQEMATRRIDELGATVSTDIVSADVNLC